MDKEALKKEIEIELKNLERHPLSEIIAETLNQDVHTKALQEKYRCIFLPI